MSFIWAQILHKCPFFSQYTPTLDPFSLPRSARSAAQSVAGKVVCPPAQAFENARVTVLMLPACVRQTANHGRRPIFPWCGIRIATRMSVCSESRRSGCFQQINLGELLVLVDCCSRSGFARCGTGFYSCGYRVGWDC